MHRTGSPSSPGPCHSSPPGATRHRCRVKGGGQCHSRQYGPSAAWLLCGGQYPSRASASSRQWTPRSALRASRVARKLRTCSASPGDIGRPSKLQRAQSVMRSPCLLVLRDGLDLLAVRFLQLSDLVVIHLGPVRDLPQGLLMQPVQDDHLSAYGYPPSPQERTHAGSQEGKEQQPPQRQEAAADPEPPACLRLARGLDRGGRPILSHYSVFPPRARRSSSSAASAVLPRTSPTVAVSAYGCREPHPAAVRSCWSRVLALLLHRMCAARLFRALSRPPSRSGTTWSIDGAHGSPVPSRARSIAVPSGQRHSGIMQTHLSRW